MVQGSNQKALSSGNVLGEQQVDSAAKSFANVNVSGSESVEREERAVCRDQGGSMVQIHFGEVLCCHRCALHEGSQRATAAQKLGRVEKATTRVAW